MHGDEHDVARLEPHVVRRVAAQQVVVDVHDVHRAAAAAHLDAAQAAVAARARREQSARERRARARDLVAARRHHLADDEHLVQVQPRHAHRVACAGAGTLPHAAERA